MNNYQEIKGDLIKFAITGKFDIIAHGCNCFCTMGAGIAPQFARHFGADKFSLEAAQFRGAVNKLGMIEVRRSNNVLVANCYTQYSTGGIRPLDYEALTLCLRKLNQNYSGKSIGLPLIGCGWAGGDWNIVKGLIQKELKDMDVTIVFYDPSVFLR